jgi:polysaccharide transporter, PST family
MAVCQRNSTFFIVPCLADFGGIIRKLSSILLRSEDIERLYQALSIVCNLSLVVWGFSTQSNCYLSNFMSQIALTRSNTERLEMKTDSIATGLSFMLIANVMQRGIGFIRNLAFCYLLSEQQLGLWALASSFFVIAAPLAVIGLPGSLNRFVEFYRVRRQLTTYIQKIAVASGICAIIFCIAIVGFSPWASELILGQTQNYATIALLAVTLLLVIIFNFLNELVSGLRQPRIASTMQMVNSMSFTGMSLTWLIYSNDYRGVIAAFAVASVLGMIPAWRGLNARCLDAFQHQEILDPRGMWQRVVPFAASIWIMNLLINLFDVVDRYMLLHCVSESIDIGQTLVGQYHSGRILPVLLTSLGMMINGILLPYMSADWEAGRPDKVARSLRSSFAFVSLFFWGLSTAGMIFAPVLFNQILQGRYSDGLAIMPLALVHCSLATVAMLLQNYFWCAERGRVVGFILTLGLVMNLALNYHMVPVYGTWGAMCATTIAGAAILGMTISALQKSGIRLGYRNLVIAALPCTLIFNTWLSAICLGIVLYLIVKTPWLLGESDKRMFAEHLQPLRKKFGF